MNEPRLRFKGFKDEWKKEKLSELSSIHARIGWQNLRTSEFLSKGDYLLITGTDFKNGEINFDSCHYINKERYDQDKKIQLKNGNILITKDGTLGKVAFVRGLNIPATLNAGVFNVVSNDKTINNVYLFHFLKAPFLMKYAKNNATGGTIKHLNQGILIDFPIPISSLEEEQKIGEFFEKLDKLIKFQSDKIEHIKKIKKGYLQNILPSKKKIIPKLIFNNSNIKWKIVKLKDIADIVGGGTPSTTIDKYWNGSINWFSPNEIGEKNFVYDSLKKITNLGLKNSSAKLHPINTILFTSRAGIGKMAILKKEAATNQGFQSLELKDHYNSYFIYSYKNEIKRKAINLSSGSTFNEISKKSMEKIKIKVPTFKEQQRIGNFFYNIDKQINLQQQKLNNLKQQKKAYLQKMFI